MAVLYCSQHVCCSSKEINHLTTSMLEVVLADFVDGSVMWYITKLKGERLLQT
jgi:hypothetical protein